MTYTSKTRQRARPIRKRVKKLADLAINEYFEWLRDNEAPHVDLEIALREFVNYCQAEGRDYKDYAAAFENSILRREEWWRDKHPEAGPGEVMFGDFKPDNSPARQAYRAAYREWKAEGEHGEAPDWQAFEHLNQRRGSDV